MKNKRMLLLVVLVLFSLNFLSAILTHGTGVTIDTSVTNLTTLNNFYNVTGSNINASSFSTACSTSDKVTNVTYSNFSGLFTVVCGADNTTAGGLTWDNIINGTVYLSNNTYGFYNSSNFNIANYLNSTHTIGNITSANTSLYNWVVAQSYTAGGINWGHATNGTLALNSNLQNGSYLNVPETDSLAYNGTLAYLSALQNGTYTATYNISYDNILTGFNNLTAIDCIAGQLVIGVQANGTVLCATDTQGTGLTFVNASVYLYNDTFVQIKFNETLAQTNLSVNSSNFWDGLGIINSTTLEEQSGGTLGIKFSWLESFIQTIVNSMTNIADWGEVVNGTVRLTTNHTFNGDVNVTGIFNATYLWGSGGNLTGVTATELDPYWSSNLTIFLAKFNATNFPNYANVYLNTSNQYNYTNKTLLSQFQNDGVFITWANAVNGTLLSQATYDTNYSALAVKADANVFTTNNTFEGIFLEKDTTNHMIYDNSSCIIIKSGGTELRLCE